VTQAVRFASLREKHRLLGGTDMPVFGKSMGSGEPEVVDYQRSYPARGVRYIDKPYRLSVYRHFLKISISISISIRSLLKISISISISIRTFLKISISISISIRAF